MLVHLADQRADFAVGELVDTVAQQPFVVGESRQGLHRSDVIIDASCAGSCLLSAVLLVCLADARAWQTQGGQPPVFRGGTNRVQVDAIVTDDNRQPLADLTAVRLRAAGRRQAGGDRQRPFSGRRRLLGRSRPGADPHARRRGARSVARRRAGVRDRPGRLSRAADGRAACHRAAARVRPSAAADRSGRRLLPVGLGDRCRVRPGPRAGDQGDPCLLRAPRRLHAEVSGRRGASQAPARDRADPASSRHLGARRAGDAPRRHQAGAQGHHLRQRGVHRAGFRDARSLRSGEPGERCHLPARSARADAGSPRRSGADVGGDHGAW